MSVGVSAAVLPQRMPSAPVYGGGGSTLRVEAAPRGAVDTSIPASDAPSEGQTDPKNEKTSSQKSAFKNDNEMTQEERQAVAELQARDTQVRAHEAAHLAAAAGIAAGGASFTYQRGPDGRMYAVGGEVPIAVRGGDDPKETVAKMRQVEAAAMAPADPSPQDYAVAANARSEEMRAMQALRKEESRLSEAEGVRRYAEAAASSSNSQSPPSNPLDLIA